MNLRTISLIGLLIISAHGKKVMLDISSDSGDQLRAPNSSILKITRHSCADPTARNLPPLLPISRPIHESNSKNSGRNIRSKSLKTSPRSTRLLVISFSHRPAISGMNPSRTLRGDSSGLLNPPPHTQAAIGSTPDPDTNSPGPNPKPWWLTATKPEKRSLSHSSIPIRVTA